MEIQIIDGNENNELRLLTKDEIDYITSVITIDMIKAVDDNNKVLILQNLRDNIKKQIKYVKIRPRAIKYAIEDIRKDILKDYDNALMKPGILVGVIASQALSQPLMQMVLNAFHSAGASAKGQNSGYKAIAEILSARDPPSVQYIKCLFNRDMSKSQMKQFINNVKDIKLKSLMVIDETTNKVDYDIDDPANIFNDRIPYWYNNFFLVFRNFKSEDLETRYMLRIKLDMIDVIKYNIKLGKLYDLIINNKSIKDNIILIMSPIRNDETFIYLDIFPIEDNIIKNSKYIVEEIGEESIIIDYLNVELLNILYDIQVSGYSNFKEIYEGTFSVWAIFSDIEYLDNNRWMLWYDTKIMKIWGVTFNKIKLLLEYLQINIIQNDENGILVQSLDDPKKIYDAKFSENRILRDEYQKEKRQLKLQKLLKGEKTDDIITIKPESTFEKLSNLNYIEINGNNLLNLFKNIYIDTYHSISNNINEIYHLFGAEAARNFIIISIQKAIEESGEYIDINHIILHGDFMTMMGGIIKFTYGGYSNLPIGPVARSKFQQVSNTIESGAAMGTIENVNIPSNFIGPHTGFGSNYNPNLISEEDKQFIRERYGYLEKVQETINDDDLNISDYDRDIYELPELADISDTADATISGTTTSLPDFSQPLKPLGEMSITVGKQTDSITSLRGLIRQKKPENLWQTNTIYKNYYLSIA